MFSGMRSRLDIWDVTRMENVMAGPCVLVVRPGLSQKDPRGA